VSIASKPSKLQPVHCGVSCGSGSRGALEIKSKAKHRTSSFKAKNARTLKMESQLGEVTITHRGSYSIFLFAFKFNNSIICLSEFLKILGLRCFIKPGFTIFSIYKLLFKANFFSLVPSSTPSPVPKDRRRWVNCAAVPARSTVCAL
jgi:hypothetical protein